MWNKTLLVRESINKSEKKKEPWGVGLVLKTSILTIRKKGDTESHKVCVSVCVCVVYV